ncbi:hypothetical protein [Streptomyces sp. NPDC006552]|uniref:hypothetical protein n=1 Tax=Streptomyces sp. NPDC006552 TaxID=3157179 RepID=UPI0033AC3CE9
MAACDLYEVLLGRARRDGAVHRMRRPAGVLCVDIAVLGPRTTGWALESVPRTAVRQPR